MEQGLPQMPSPEPPKDSVAPVPEISPVSVINQSLTGSTDLQGIAGFTSGMEGGQGDGTAATNKSKIEIAPSAETEIDKYMTVVREALSLSEGDSGREEKMLEFMGQLEKAKANGEIELGVIGEGRDRTVLLGKPVEMELIEPAHIPMKVEERIGLRVGDMVTEENIYLAANRKGFTGLAVTRDQLVKIDPAAEMFTMGGSSFLGGQYGVDFFQQQFGGWLKDCQQSAQRNGLEGERRIGNLMQRKNFQEKPEPANYKTGGILGLVQANPEYIEDGKAWVDSDSVRPDGLWASFITRDDSDITTPYIRRPGISGWFDLGGNGYKAFKVKNPATVDSVLKTNIKPAQLSVEAPKPNPSLVSTA